ncbi:hypothetical protein F4802DRAFT_20262 [Xylaria palmicola]|nr:hypothetical protein F4802DRAFT_20262 [Xylaria palmicola]
MRHLVWTRGLLAALTAGAALAQEGDAPDTGEHPEWPRWCGKVYQPGYPSFEPGGHTTAPPTNGSTYLHVQFSPRHSLYLAGEARASFIVSAALSPWFGGPYADADATTGDGGAVAEPPFTELAFTIRLADDADVGHKKPLVESRIAVNATGVEFGFDLAAAGLRPRTAPYAVVLSGAPAHGDHGGHNRYSYTAASELLYLPDNPEGSATKIDHLNGGLLFKSPRTGGQFAPLLPYGYYGLYGGSNDTAAADAFVRGYTSNGTGLNAIIALAGFADTNPVYDSMDAQGLHFMFDLRGSYKNLTETAARANTIKHHTSLFAYWTADEPDGWQVPFDKTPAAQALLHALDPYHPVAITLNCADFYFGAYAAGGDLLMEDVYPVGINATFSKWGTAVNATLGDCGCDDCAGDGPRDVARRLDALARHERHLGRWPPLPRLHNPQSFHGEGYWARDPDAAEARAMNALALHRGATGFFAWTWPGTSEALFATHTDMARVVTAPPVRDFVLGGRPAPLVVDEGGSEEEVVDAAYWVGGGGEGEKKMMVSVVNGGYEDIGGRVALALPVAATGVESVPFGGLSWRLLDGKLVVDGLPAMSTSFIILSIDTKTGQ